MKNREAKITFSIKPPCDKYNRVNLHQDKKRLLVLKPSSFSLQRENSKLQLHNFYSAPSLISKAKPLQNFSHDLININNDFISEMLNA